ncbi:DNA cytosine methyltransferase [Glaciecola sp. XM2]|nr:DNA cytosine methyltransferase [Glaciecola sp. XM2]
MSGEKNEYPFEPIISVEKDTYAHKTLTVRAFYRLLLKNKIRIPHQYYEYLAGNSESPSCDATDDLWRKAQSETVQLELGASTEKDISFFESLKSSYEEVLANSPTILIGGPPCQAYSLVGRARNKGNKSYKPERDKRHVLYKEYLQIMRIFAPDFFVMENVKGMLSSQLDGGLIFDQILEDLETCGDSGYQLYSLKTGQQYIRGLTSPSDFLLLSEEYGVPQKRHRVIIFGVRKNSRYLAEKIPNLKVCRQVSVEKAMSDLPKLRSKLSSRGTGYKIDSDKSWKSNLKRGVSRLTTESTLDSSLKSSLQTNLDALLESELPAVSSRVFDYRRRQNSYDKFVKDANKQPITFHEPRPHMDSDLVRYFFCATFRQTFGRNPRAHEFPDTLAPKHKNWKSGKFVDRFKVQHFSKPSSTITSHISKDGHYFIHSDPVQCRSLTAREAARLQTFPDSYQFAGKRTNQYQQIGNAVPPLLARQIAECVFKLITNSD